jgi:trigger factor
VFEVLPEITLAPLEGRTIQTRVAAVEESDVDRMIDRLRKQRQTWNEVQRPAKDGDRLTISFEGTVDGEPFQGGSAEDVPLVLGSGSMIPGFEEGLEGAGGGDARSLEATFPEDYRVKDLAGKPAKFEVQVKAVAEPVLPEVDAEFAKAFGVASGDLDQLRADIRNNMERELRQRLRSQLKTKVMDLLVEANPLEVPKALVNQEIEDLRQQMRQNMGGGAGNMQLPSSLFEEQARRRVSVGLIMAEVVKVNAIEPDPARVQTTLEEIASTYEDPQQVISYYRSNPEQRAAVENLVREDQVVDWVLGQVQVVEEQSTFEAVTEAAE